MSCIEIFIVYSTINTVYKIFDKFSKLTKLSNELIGQSYDLKTVPKDIVKLNTKILIRLIVHYYPDFGSSIHYNESISFE